MQKRLYDAILTEGVLRELYLERGMTLDELQVYFRINRSTIAAYLEYHGISRRPLGSWVRTHAFDERFFEHIDSYEKAYIVGLFMSDGCITSNLATIALQERDGHLLEQIAQLMGDPTLVTKRRSDGRGLGANQQDQFVLSITRKKVANDLVKIGVPRSPKSGKERFIDFSDNRLTWCFIRGISDGDGTIGKYETSFTQKGRSYGPYTVCQWAIACSVELLEGLSSFLARYGIIVTPKGIITKDNTGWMRIQNKQTLREVRQHLYRDGTLWLERKKEQFFSI